jgi:hypothetical protein
VRNITGGLVTVSPESVELLKQIFVETIEKGITYLSAEVPVLGYCPKGEAVSHSRRRTERRKGRTDMKKASNILAVIWTLMLIYSAFTGFSSVDLVKSNQSAFMTFLNLAVLNVMDFIASPLSIILFLTLAVVCWCERKKKT